MAAHSMDFMGWFAVTKYSTGSDRTKSWSSTVSNGIRFNIEHATDFQRIPFDSAAHYLGEAIQTRSSLGASGIARLLWTCEVFDAIPSHRKTVVPNDIQQAIHVCIVTNCYEEKAAPSFCHRYLLADSITPSDEVQLQNCLVLRVLGQVLNVPYVL